MTTPAQHNCAHSPDGWCLTCVGKLASEAADLRSTNARLRRECDEALQRVEQLEADRLAVVLGELDAGGDRLVRAASALVASCDGRLPADSSDSVAVESIRVRLLALALLSVTGRAS